MKFLKTTLFFTFLVVSALVVSATSYAADSPYDGPYIGFNANYSRMKADTTFGSGSLLIKDYTIKDDGSSFGFFGGWNKTFSSNILLGIEASYNENNLEFDNPRQLAGSVYYPNSLSLDRAFAGVVRLGLVHQNTLLYGLAGITSGKFKTDLWSNPDPLVINGSKKSEYKTGYIIGLGIEQFVYKNIAIRVEYSFSDYGSITSESSGPFTTYKYTFDNKLSSYKVGLSYNF